MAESRTGKGVGKQDQSQLQQMMAQAMEEKSWSGEEADQKRTSEDGTGVVSAV